MNHDRIPEIALDWHRSGRGAALATVVETWGSAPRQTGSQMVVSGLGEMMGSVSGGCVEGAVVAEAVEALGEGRPRLLSYGVSDEDAFAVGLACGGRVSILVEPIGAVLPEPLLAELVAARAARRPVAYVTRADGSGRRIATGSGGDALDSVVARRLRADRSGLEEDGTFIAVHNPQLRLIVVGAVHIAQPLVALARLCDYDPMIIDPRTGFAATHRFPGERIVEDWPGAAIAALEPDHRTAVVILSHDPKLDDPALRAALATPAFYIGCLGSSRTHEQRVGRLRAGGIAEEAIARIHAPVGLAIGAKSPAEIAVAILAQITQRLRQA